MQKHPIDPTTSTSRRREDEAAPVTRSCVRFNVEGVDPSWARHITIFEQLQRGAKSYAHLRWSSYEGLRKNVFSSGSSEGGEDACWPKSEDQPTFCNVESYVHIPSTVLVSMSRFPGISTILRSSSPKNRDLISRILHETKVRETLLRGLLKFFELILSNGGEAARWQKSEDEKTFLN